MELLREDFGKVLPAQLFPLLRIAGNDLATGLRRKAPGRHLVPGWLGAVVAFAVRVDEAVAVQVRDVVIPRTVVQTRLGDDSVALPAVRAFRAAQVLETRETIRVVCGHWIAGIAGNGDRRGCRDARIINTAHRNIHGDKRTDDDRKRNNIFRAHGPLHMIMATIGRINIMT